MPVIPPQASGSPIPVGAASCSGRPPVACWSAWGGGNPRARLAVPAGLTHLKGTDFALTIGELPVRITDRERLAVAVNGSLPAPVLHWQEGDTVTAARDESAEGDRRRSTGTASSLPTGMDGVPGLSFPGIAPGETFTYQFPVRQSGTYWYHSHSGFQEQLGLYGALVIHPREPEPVAVDRDYVVLLSDWTDENPARVLAKLKKQSDYYNFNQPTLGDLVPGCPARGPERGCCPSGPCGARCA